MPFVLNPNDVCEDCGVKWTTEDEWVMDDFKCYDQQEYCLNCCGCPEHKGEPKWYKPKEN
jgi:hypothetical protein